MSVFTSCIYDGTVMHVRLTPRRHAFSYKVFSLCLDLDEVDRVAAGLRLFSRNRANVLSFCDGDHAADSGNSAADNVRGILAGAGLASAGTRIALLCYPRLLGYVFNPLAVYFCREATGRLAAIIYEVRNTFGESTSYVIPVTGDDAEVTQSCRKAMYVSPFTACAGQYGFHVRPPDENVFVGIDLTDATGPVLRTQFRGVRRPLTDRSIAALVARRPLMTFKVVGAIHFEAVRLWLKGVPLVRRHASPRSCVHVIDPIAPESSNVR